MVILKYVELVEIESGVLDRNRCVVIFCTIRVFIPYAYIPYTYTHMV